MMHVWSCRIQCDSREGLIGHLTNVTKYTAFSCSTYSKVCSMFSWMGGKKTFHSKCLFGDEELILSSQINNGSAIFFISVTKHFKGTIMLACYFRHVSCEKKLQSVHYEWFRGMEGHSANIKNTKATQGSMCCNMSAYLGVWVYAKFSWWSKAPDFNILDWLSHLA